MRVDGCVWLKMEMLNNGLRMEILNIEIKLNVLRELISSRHIRTPKRESRKRSGGDDRTGTFLGGHQGMFCACISNDS